MRNTFFLFFFTFLHCYSQYNVIDDAGFKQGYWKLFFPYTTDSIVSEEGSFVNDLEDGLWIKYHDNTQIREVLYFSQGLLNGLKLSIDKKGKLKKQEFFVNDQHDGDQLYFHDNGKISMKISYVHGIRHGPFIKYYKNGKKQETVKYVNSKKHGVANWYFDNEQISLQYIYNQGFIVDTAYAYYKDGVLKSTSFYVNNMLDGEKIIYYPSGIIKQKGSFLKDQKHGFWYEYDTLGYELNRIKYNNGLKK